MSEIILCTSADCVGCAACSNICDKGAIRMTADARGFLKPQIDYSKCNKCLKCHDVCQIFHTNSKNTSQIEATYAVWAQNKEIHKNSNSGGLFEVFARKIFKLGGVVCGARYDQNMKVCHQIIYNESDIQYLKYSKFSQSDIGDCLRQIRDLLQEKRYVLFVGTPCQVEGLNAFLKEPSEYLLTVQFPCFGIPSPLFFESYLKSKVHDELCCLNNVYCEIQDNTDINQRFMKLELKNGTEIVASAGEDSFVRMWNAGFGIEEHCFSCERNFPPGQGDFIWGNFWQLGLVNRFPVDYERYQDGVSFLVVCSKKGKDFFKLCEEDLEFYKRKLVEILAGHYYMYSTTSRHLLFRKRGNHKKYNEFMLDMPKISFEELAAKYQANSDSAFRISRFIPRKIIGLIWRMLYYAHRVLNR